MMQQKQQIYCHVPENVVFSAIRSGNRETILTFLFYFNKKTITRKAIYLPFCNDSRKLTIGILVLLFLLCRLYIFLSKVAIS